MPAGQTFSEPTYYLPDLVSDGLPILNCTFSGCLLLGPAVLLLGGEIGLYGENRVDEKPLKRVLWECYEKGRSDDYIGAIRVVDSTFEKVIFQRIGFMGLPDIIARLSDVFL